MDEQNTNEVSLQQETAKIAVTPEKKENTETKSTLCGLEGLVGTALSSIGLFVLKVMTVALLVTGVVTWFKWLKENYKVFSRKGTTISVSSLQNMFNDAKGNATDIEKKKFAALEKALLSGCDRRAIVALAQNDKGDVIAATSFEAEDYTHQSDDARDYTIAIDQNGRILEKIRIS